MDVPQVAAPTTFTFRSLSEIYLLYHIAQATHMLRQVSQSLTYSPGWLTAASSAWRHIYSSAHASQAAQPQPAEANVAAPTEPRWMLELGTVRTDWT